MIFHLIAMLTMVGMIFLRLTTDDISTAEMGIATLVFCVSAQVYRNESNRGGRQP